MSGQERTRVWWLTVGLAAMAAGSCQGSPSSSQGSPAQAAGAETTNEAGAQPMPTEAGGASDSAAGTSSVAGGDGGTSSVSGGAGSVSGGEGGAASKADGGAAGSAEPRGCGSPVPNVSRPRLSLIEEKTFDTSATAVSADGTTVLGQFYFGNNEQHAFSWTLAAGLTDLTLATSGKLIAGTLISCDSTVIVGASDTGYARYSKAAGLVPLQRCDATHWASIADMDATANVLVGDCAIDATNYSFELWAGSNPPTGIAGLNGLFINVSADGTIVSGVARGARGSLFRWTAQGGVQPITTDLGSEVMVMSADGNTIVGTAQNRNLFRWRNGTITSRPCSGGCIASAVSGDGQVIVAEESSLHDYDSTVIWAGEGDPYSLRDKLQSSGVDVSNWDTISIYDISDEARVLVGTFTKNGVQGVGQRAFYLQVPAGFW